ncbi:MAG: hypothetical protein H6810_10000 [Phycisphaeraceae bacterium]|nr:MAG: hypothetical protein H6810_10000 [Phycisphaeraceae bacterium]
MPRHDQTPHEAGDHHEEAGGPETERGGSAVWHSIVKWATRATVAGALLSLLIHLGLWMVAGFLTIRYPSADAGGAPQGNQVDFAVMTEAELAALLAPAEDVPQPLVPESEAPVDPATTDLRTAAPSSVESLTDATLDVQIDAGAGDVGEGDGEGLVTGAGGGGASFFGLEAQGSRFAYIVDRSSSMRGEKMARTRAELERSVTELAENGEFLVVFYSDQPEALGGRPQWRDASEKSKAEARRLIGAVMPMGGTKPTPAFEMVFERRIKPDAIYFMTDGRFGDEVPGQIEAMNRRYRIPIHCILFGEASTNSVISGEVRVMMEQIAQASGGRFRQVEVTP